MENIPNLLQVGLVSAEDESPPTPGGEAKPRYIINLNKIESDTKNAFELTFTWIDAGSLTSLVLALKVQWAAVRMWRLVMMEPPQ